MRIAISLALIPLALVLGCTEKPAGEHKLALYPVAGKLLVDDLPAANARLAFHPVDKKLAGILCPVGIADSDGSFRLTTYSGDDGAPAGDYIVTVIWPPAGMEIDICACFDPLTHDRLRGVYADAATSTLRASVLPRQNEIHLQALVGAQGWNLPRRRDSEKQGLPTTERRDR